MFIVTGATKGIGNAVAACLAARGLEVIAVGRSSDSLAELREQFSDLITPVIADLSKPTGVEQILNAIPSHSSISGIVHSAGSLVSPESYRSLCTDSLVEHFRLHVAAQILLYQKIAQTTSVDRMLFIDSYSASQPRDGWAAYSIIKSAAQMAARCASQELKDTTVVRVLPGAVHTRVVDTIIASGTKAGGVFEEMLKSGKVAQPTAVASFIVSLLVDTPDEILESVDAWDYNNPKHFAKVMTASDA